MKQLIGEPKGWTCTIEEYPAGFFVCDGNVGFKTEYHSESGDIQAYCDSGEAFCPREITVQPIVFIWEDDE